MLAPPEVSPVTGPVVAVRVHADGSATLDGTASDSSEVATAIRSHIRAHPDGGVAFSASRDAPYARYIHFLDAIKAAYLTERDAVAVRQFGEPYADLSDAEQEAIRELVPIRISLAEPE